MNDAWMQIIVLVGSNLLIMVTFFGISAGMLWSFRKDSKEDWIRHSDKTDQILKAIQDEMKDFHERLLKIETERSWGAVKEERQKKSNV